MTQLLFRMLRRIPPSCPGKKRLGRLALRFVGARGPTTISDRDGRVYEVPDLWEPIAFDLAVDGVYEPETLEFILGNIHDGGVFVDVAANVGVFTIPAVQHVGVGGRVLAVEASP